jgi:hypothetical protein
MHMELKNLSKEQREAIRDCKTTEDLLDLIKNDVIELEDWQLERVVGGVNAPMFNPWDMFGIEHT